MKSYIERRIEDEVGKVRTALTRQAAHEIKEFRFTCTTSLRDTIKSLEERVTRLERIVAEEARGKK